MFNQFVLMDTEKNGSVSLDQFKAARPAIELPDV